MTRSNAAHEPSMDEILASIRRIIESGDERPEPVVTARVRPERAPHVERLEPGAESAANVVARLTPENLPVETGGLPATDASFVEETSMGEPGEAAVPEPDEPSSAVEAEHSIFGSAGEEDELVARLRDELSAEDMIDWSALTAALTEETDEPVDTTAEMVVQESSSAEDERQGEEAPSSSALPTLRRAVSISGEPQQSGMAAESDAIASESAAPQNAFEASGEDGETPGLDAPFVAANSDSRRMQEFRAAVLDDLDGESRTATGTLTSGRTGELVGAAFDDLAEAIREGQMRSMEEMAQDLLRPMLQDWLDENLPKLVERLVREEIERVARGGRR